MHMVKQMAVQQRHLLWFQAGGGVGWVQRDCPLESRTDFRAFMPFSCS